MPQKCFVICPIGAEETKIRKASDQLMRHILVPVLAEKGYEPFTADQMPRPGMITNQIIEALLEVPLVIADLSGANPNVFYELAVRHASRLPYIQMIQDGEKIPFDLHGVRTIYFNLRDPDRVESAKATLRRQIVEIDSGQVIDSPVSAVLTESLFRGNENALQLFLEKFWKMEGDFERVHQSLEKLGAELESVKDDISSLESDVSSIESAVDSIKDSLE
jgi:hypothetical protein